MQKNRVLKIARENDQVTYKGRHIRITPGHLAGTFKARKTWKYALQALNDHYCQQENYLLKLKEK